MPILAKQRPCRRSLFLAICCERSVEAMLVGRYPYGFLTRALGIGCIFKCNCGVWDDNQTDVSSCMSSIDMLTMNKRIAISWPACLAQDRLSMWEKWAPCSTAYPGTCHVNFHGDSRASIWPDSNGPAFQGEGLGRDTKLRAQWGRPERLLNSLEQQLVW